MVFMRGSIIKKQSHTSTEVNRAKQKARYSYPAIKTVISPRIKENTTTKCHHACPCHEAILVFRLEEFIEHSSHTGVVSGMNTCFCSNRTQILASPHQNCTHSSAFSLQLQMLLFIIIIISVLGRVLSQNKLESTLFYTICMEFQMFSFPSHLPKIGQYLD